MKSEFVVWEEGIRVKKYDPMMNRRMTNPKHPSGWTWVITFMEDVMNEKGHVLFTMTMILTSIKTLYYYFYGLINK